MRRCEQMNIYDPKYFTTTNCPLGLQTTPQGTYCQMMGDFVMPLNDYNTIAMCVPHCHRLLGPPMCGLKWGGG